MLWSLSAEIAESSSWHDHDIFEFALCLDHGGSLLTDDGEVDLRPARTILVPPGTHHRFVLDTSEIGRLKIICVPPKDLACFVSPFQISMLEGLCGMGVSVADHPGQELWLSQLSSLIVDGLGTDKEPSAQLNWSAMSLLLSLHAKERYVGKDHSSNRHRAKILDLLSWIENNLAEELSIQQATFRSGLSRSLLTREFRLYTGKSFVDYCNVRRVQKAATILVTRPHSVTQAALDSGFSNLSHFHRQFKAHFGLAPAAFRRKVIEEGGLR
ncbi:MAG TPA: AraC family transcriptional regulator [Candidatus Saccharimonadales bacterium]|nr:AraC family transcriptional regulator [Candidatus Saccharimonadales bacterium]